MNLLAAVGALAAAPAMAVVHPAHVYTLDNSLADANGGASLAR